MKTAGFAMELYKCKLEELGTLCGEIKASVWDDLSPAQRNHVRDTRQMVGEKLSSLEASRKKSD